MTEDDIRRIVREELLALFIHPPDELRDQITAIVSNYLRQILDQMFVEGSS